MEFSFHVLASASASASATASASAFGVDGALQLDEECRDVVRCPGPCATPASYNEDIIRVKNYVSIPELVCWLSVKAHK